MLAFSLSLATASFSPTMMGFGRIGSLAKYWLFPISVDTAIPDIVLTFTPTVRPCSLSDFVPASSHALRLHHDYCGCEQSIISGWSFYCFGQDFTASAF